MTNVTRIPLTPDTTLRELVGMSLDRLTAGQEAGIFQIGVVLEDGRKAVISVAITSEIVAEFPSMLPGSGGMTMQ